MKYKCKLKVTNDDEGTYFIIANCFSWRYLEDQYYLEVLKGDEALFNYYSNFNMNKIISQIKDRIIKHHYPSYDVKQVIKLIESTNKITIDI